jgi:DNA invertase Pin-like site-specific DNA recombinase
MAPPRGDRAVIYVRESLDRYGDERAVERFEEQCRQLVQARGLRLVADPVRDNDVRASNGNKGDGFAEVMRMIRARETDYVVIPVVDRFFRSLRDLEDVIDVCLETGVALVAASGEIDLSHDQGRLVARLLTSVAKAETERKGARQRAATEQAARAGKRPASAHRPFGYQDGGCQLDLAEADAVRWAADCLLGGGTVSAVMREWERRGLVTAQTGRPFTRQSITTILRNPRIAGLATLPRGDGDRFGEIVGRGQWEAILPEQTWRAVEALLDDPGRKPPKGVRTLLGGLARCQCGNPVTAMPNHRGYRVYRCTPATRNGRPGPHVSVRVAEVDAEVEARIVAWLSQPGLAEVVTPAPHTDTAALRTEAASIRANLDEMAADRALGLVTRSQMIAATERGNARLDQIGAALAEAANAGALAPFLSAGHRAATVWDGLDRSRKRAVLGAATAGITLHPAGRGARTLDLDRIVAVEWAE